ncbi:TIGR02677 family protein [Cupriavidus basilensis]
MDFLVQKGNLEAHPDTARYSTLDDFYRNQSIYSLSRKGEAVEAAMLVYQQGLVRRGELQAVALEDITSRLQSLILLKDAPELDVPKAHETLRDLIARFEEMTEKARDFMAEMGRTLVLSGAEIQVVEKYKLQLLSYLERFLSDLVRRLDSISQLIAALEGSIQYILMAIADREARDSAPGSWEGTDFRMRYRKDWTNRWLGLKRWFVSTDQSGSEADNLRQCARNAINQLSDAVNTINDRRAGRSDRSADFVTLAGWFMGCADDAEANCLARAAFALNPARHFPLATQEQEAVPPSTSWVDAPPLEINLRLYQYGDAQMRGQLPGVRDRSAERAEIARRLADESQQVEAARRRLATGKATRLSDLGPLNPEEFSAFLALLGDALDHQAGPDATVEVTTGDGQLAIRLEPLGPDTHARIETPAGVFSGRDHILTISRTRHD